MSNIKDENKRKLRQQQLWSQPKNGITDQKEDQKPKSKKSVMAQRFIRPSIIIIIKIFGMLAIKLLGAISVFQLVAEKKKIMNSNKSDIIKMKQLELLREEAHKQGRIDYNDPFWRDLK